MESKQSHFYFNTEYETIFFFFPNAPKMFISECQMQSKQEAQERQCLPVFNTILCINLKLNQLDILSFLTLDYLSFISVNKNSFKYVQSVNSLCMETNKLGFFHHHWLHNLTTHCFTCRWSYIWLRRVHSQVCQYKVLIKCSDEGA